MVGPAIPGRGDAPPETVVIVGAGHCGGQVAMHLRRLGHTGRIMLLGDEPFAPYERPPLSKAMLAGEARPDASLLRPADWWAGNAIDLRPDTRVIRIDPESRIVATARGHTIPWDALVLATGGTPRPCPFPVDPDAPVHALKTRTDLAALRETIARGRRAVIVGGGFLGLEVAATLVALGLAVDLVELAPRLLPRALPETVSAIIAATFRAHGVGLHLGARPLALAAARGGVALALDDGGTLTGDFAVAALGQRPDLGPADGLGITGPDGVVTDESCRTALPGVHAAGDLAVSPRRRGPPCRIESWANAEHQAEVAACAVLGLVVPPPLVPWFWTDHFGLTLRIAGDLTGPNTRIAEIATAADGARLFHACEDGTLVGAAGYGSRRAVTRPLRLAEQAIARGQPADTHGRPDLRPGPAAGQAG